MSIKSSMGFSSMRRYPQRGWIAGVCAGVADYFDWNVKLLRVIVAVAFLFSGFFPVGLVYCVLWYVLDPGPADDARADRSYTPSYGSPPPRAARSSGDVTTRFSHLEDRLRNIEECVTSREFELRRELRKLET